MYKNSKNKHYYIGDNMKKIMVIIAILFIPLIINKNMEEDTIIIPEDSLRIRIIANSNSIEDQYEKNRVKDDVQLYLREILKNSKSKEEAKDIINKNINNIENIVSTTLKELNSNNKYTIKLGNNYFPEKEYKGVTYESGLYDSLVISIGKAQGNNWWCVLFPPLCLMETEENMNDYEYKSFIIETLKKYQN